MRLTSHTDYSLRVLLALAARPEDYVPVSVLAGRFRVSLTHLQKVVQHLVRTGWIASARGRGGGVRLAMSPSEIRVGEVIRTMEADLALVDCMNPEGTDCPLAGACGLQRAMHEARAAFFASLNQHTLASLAESSGGLRRLMEARAAAEPS